MRGRHPDAIDKGEVRTARRWCQGRRNRRVELGQPSRQSHSAHNTEHVTVQYPWHPLHGQTIVMKRSVRHGREVWLCESDQRTAAIPVWLTDRVACAALSMGPVSSAHAIPRFDSMRSSRSRARKYGAYLHWFTKSQRTSWPRSIRFHESCGWPHIGKVI